MNTISENFVTKDILLPFQLESTFVRGRLVRLGSVLDEILGKHHYPVPVEKLLTEALVMAAALGTALKFDGVFTLQTKTNGPLRAIVVDVTSDGALRACAQFDADKVTQDREALLGQGHLVFTVDQIHSDERYQGIVALDGQNLLEAFQTYFRKSEQIPTGLYVASHRDEVGHWHAGCLMLQRMPSEGGNEKVAADTAQEDDWLRIMTLMQTCTAEEVTSDDLAPEDLLYRLFHEEGVRVYDAQDFHHECRCSKEKIKGVLSGMPLSEIAEMAQEEGHITVTCEFCSQSYVFEEKDFASKEG